MTYKLLTENEIKNGMFFEFNVDAILRSTLKERYESYGIGIEKGFLMPNEARQKENLPSIEGGDQLIVNGTYQPLENVGMAYLTPEENVKNLDKGGEDNDKTTE